MNKLHQSKRTLLQLQNLFYNCYEVSHFRDLDLHRAQKCSISQNDPNSRYLWAFGWVNLQQRTSPQGTEKTIIIHTPSNLLLLDKALSVKSTSIVPFLLCNIYIFVKPFILKRISGFFIPVHSCLLTASSQIYAKEKNAKCQIFM